MRAGFRSQPLGAYLFFFASFAAILFLSHAAYLSLPYFWDELGQFVPAALDIYHDGALVPHSAVPNVHPPGVMGWLALTWKIAGYSIPATRSAMLGLASLGVLFGFLLAIQLCRGLGGAPALFAILLLLADPLFYTQSMMAQLDMPAMVFGLGALLLFLQGRHLAAGLLCLPLVLAKETGILLPLIFSASLLIQRGREKQAAYYAPSFLVLAAWLGLLWHTTGHLFGDPGFAHYNIAYSLHPMRATASLIRRIYYLFLADFRWVGTIAIIHAFKKGLFRSYAWRITGTFVGAHVLLVSLLGGAELERYLVPVLPVFYIATAAAWTILPVLWRNLSLAALVCGLIAGLFVNPPYPFPYENNLAMADFVELHRTAARYLEQGYGERAIYTAWPLTAALRQPEFGYVQHGLKTHETSDLRASTLEKLDSRQVEVLVLYSRTWEPEWGVLRYSWARRFLAKFYEYEPQMSAEECRDRLGLRQVIRWSRRGQWIEIYDRDPAGGVFPVRLPVRGRPDPTHPDSPLPHTLFDRTPARPAWVEPPA